MRNVLRSGTQSDGLFCPPAIPWNFRGQYYEHVIYHLIKGRKEGLMYAVTKGNVRYVKSAAGCVGGGSLCCWWDMPGDSMVNEGTPNDIFQIY